MKWKEVSINNIFHDALKRNDKPITGGVIMPPRQVDLTQVYTLIKKLEKRVAELEKRQWTPPNYNP